MGHENETPVAENRRKLALWSLRRYSYLGGEEFRARCPTAGISHPCVYKQLERGKHRWISESCGLRASLHLILTLIGSVPSRCLFATAIYFVGSLPRTAFSLKDVPRASLDSCTYFFVLVDVPNVSLNTALQILRPDELLVNFLFSHWASRLRCYVLLYFFF